MKVAQYQLGTVYLVKEKRSFVCFVILVINFQRNFFLFQEKDEECYWSLFLTLILVNQTNSIDRILYVNQLEISLL